jgi:hypothetical protein
MLLNNIHNFFGPEDGVFILDFQTPQSTHSKHDRKMNLNVQALNI